MSRQSELNGNPIKRLRLANNLTIAALAAQAEVSPNLIIRNEQGMYSNPSPVLCYFFRNRTEITSSEQDIQLEYLEFQRTTRKMNYGMLSEPPLYLGTKFEYHPFTAWRLQSAPHGLNLTQVAKAFCVQQSLLHKFENQPHLCYSLPEPLIHALLEAGYSHQTIDNEQRWFQLYREQLDRKAKV